MTTRTLVWFRGKDLRLADHAPLRDAVYAGEVIPLFVLDPYFFAPARAAQLPHRIQFLLDSLEALQQQLAERGSRLVLASGKSTEVIPRLVSEWNITRVVAQRWVEPFARERDRRIQEALGDRFELYEGETLLAPGTLRTGAGTPYSVFTPFARAFRERFVSTKAVAAPKILPPVPSDIPPNTVLIPTCESLGIARNPKILSGGERAAAGRLRRFLRAAAATYPVGRDRMDWEGTSRLSADLKFGVLTSRQVWRAVEKELAGSVSGVAACRTFHNELIWREFAHSSLWDRPELLTQPFRAGFVGFPWENGDDAWQAWTLGTTGYPIVDASARQLLGEGFVHNRARMISASFLTKHLLTDYRRGEAHYMKYLTDGDWAQNNAGWQWSAGCGCDAQPYFRIFNPVTQGVKFDPEGDYVRRWIPELARMPARFIHRPWEAPDSVLRGAGVVLGSSYPRPVVDHRFARERFLAVSSAHLKQKGAAPLME